MTILIEKTDDNGLLAHADVLAAKMFPDRWALALQATGKKGSNRRRMIRRQAENEVVLIGLRAVGAKCGTCDHRSKRDGGLICDLDSDFYGYVRVKADHLCARFKKAIAQAQQVTHD